MSQTIKYSKTKMSPKLNITKTELSLKEKCHKKLKYHLN